MKKLHLALSTDNISETVVDYTNRLGAEPCLVIPGEYALWRTEHVNLSIRQDPTRSPGALRHLGWEDPTATEFTVDTDVNGVMWERFHAGHQADEINELWPDARYEP